MEASNDAKLSKNGENSPANKKAEVETKVSAFMNQFMEFFEDVLVSMMESEKVKEKVTLFKTAMQSYQEASEENSLDVKTNLRPIKIAERCAHVHLKHRLAWKGFPERWVAILKFMGHEGCHPVLIKGMLKSDRRIQK